MVSSGQGTRKVGKKWKYLQILVVVPSEVDEYKKLGPKTGPFAIFALPDVAEKLGIGCSRYFTKKLAEKICPPSFPFCLIMDDSVQYWCGITLPKDFLKPFGEDPRQKSVR